VNVFLRGERKAENMVSMPAFLDEDFLLSTATARRLYQEHAAPQPIIDYHTHLSAANIASDRRFSSLYEIWLEGDHYKWRAMRADGVAEALCSGDGPSSKKLLCWAATIRELLGNPLFHWTHLELQRHFGIHELPHNALELEERASAVLREGLTVRAILAKFKVQAVFTTDDPVDDLSAHRTLAEEFRQETFDTDVRPTFRPDRALPVAEPEIFLPWVKKLEEASNVEVRNLGTFLEALQNRHEYFVQSGCCASDHGLERCPARPCSESTAAAIFSKALDKQPITPEEAEQYATFLQLFLARLYTNSHWVMQLHLGALRNPSSTAYANVGPDTGFDTIGDFPQGIALARFLDLLQRENALPKTILYNSNPADNHVFAAMANSFHATETREQRYTGALQWGPPWWFLDQKQGITEHLNTLSSLGSLSRFVGMTTDSRSFMSFPRHEYFRRILCDLLGGQVERGELPDDVSSIGGLVKKLCFKNAQLYFGISGRRKLVFPT
jgi:glucuronate isomerase